MHGYFLMFWSIEADMLKFSWASIQQAVRRLTARSSEVSKSRDSGLDFLNRSEI